MQVFIRKCDEDLEEAQRTIRALHRRINRLVELNTQKTERIKDLEDYLENFPKEGDCPFTIAEKLNNILEKQ